MQPFRQRLARAACLLLMAPAAFAHPGHGLAAPSHWHAMDTPGLLLVSSLAVLVAWLSRGGK